MTEYAPPDGFPRQLTGAAPELITDLYQLTMGQSYLSHGMTGEATFEIFTRRMPRDRNFLMTAGLEDAVDFLSGLEFGDDAIAYLETLGTFREPFLAYLRGMRFTGDVWGMPEGELFFPFEPILRVTAPIIEAQFVETFLLNIVGFQSLVASKAARITIAAAGTPYADFSPRRDHGQDAALLAARASAIAGAASTSNVQAGQYYGLPVSGTMAHSYVLSFDHEVDAFRAFLEDYPQGTTLLIDTYDTVEGARRVVQLLRDAGDRFAPAAVRIDSGDLDALSRKVRRVLDDGGYPAIRIFVSGDLDEWRIEQLVRKGAPIDAYGVGTQLGTGGDDPSLGVVYKLVADAQGPKMKLSPDKSNLPGAKQVYRVERGGRMTGDTMALADEQPAEGRPLLEPVMRRGERVRARTPIAQSRERAAAALDRLPPPLRSMRAADRAYPVHLSAGLRALTNARPNG